MIVKDLLGNEYKIGLKNYGANRECRSNLHLEARILLKEIFSPFFIFEEVPIKVYPKKTLFVDFWIENYNYIFEISGKQHFKYTPYYHGDQLGFLSQNKNDRLKKEWIELNNFKYIELQYNENIDEWRNKITGRLY